MTTAVIAAAPPPSPLIDLPGSREMPRKRWTRDEYDRLMTLGLLPEGSSYELIEGEIVFKMPQGRRHMAACMRIQERLIDVFGRGRIQSQGPIAADDYSEPEPDIAVLRGRVDDYMDDDPGPGEILLLVEVSNTSLRADRTVKAALYARAGIPEYWILDVNERTLEVLRQPGPGGYVGAVLLREADAVFPLAAPDAAIPVADLLPPT